MTIIGFNFSKINVEKKQTSDGKISIKNNLSIKNLRNKEIGLSKEQGAFEADFDYSVVYQDEKKSSFGKISLEGSMVFLGEKALINDVIKQYKKDKSIKPEIVTPLLNFTFNKCTVESLLLSKEVNLPTPVQLPRLRVGKKE